MSELTPRQAAFVAEYLCDLNATQAAIRAGYSAKTAYSIGPRLLDNVGIQKALTASKEQRIVRVEVTADQVVRELSHVAFLDPADVASQPMSGPEDIARLPEHVRRAIVGWGWDKLGNFTLKFAPKTTALEMLGRHLGLFKDRLWVSGPDGSAVQVEAVRSRVEDRLAKLMPVVVTNG